MNEIFLNNASMPVLCGCDFFTAAESFYHADRTVDFNIPRIIIISRRFAVGDGSEISALYSEGDLVNGKGSYFGDRRMIPVDGTIKGAVLFQNKGVLCGLAQIGI